MSSIVVNGDTSGSVTLSAPATAGTVTVTLPSASGTMAVSGGSTSFTNLAYTGTLTGGTGVVNLGSGQVYKDASGNVGIGTSSPTFKIQAQGSTPAYFGVDATGGTQVGYAAALPSNSVSCFVGWIPDSVGTGGVNGDLGLCPRTSAGANIRFFTGSTTATERARIDSSGNLLVGTTSAISSFNMVLQHGNAGIGAGLATVTTTLDAVNALSFRNPNGQIGRVQVNLTTTTYVTSSDYRLKENIAPMTGALDKVSKLKPVTYTWKTDGTSGQGFIAHTLQEFYPEAVAGTKDEVDTEGNPVHQGVDTSFLVATLAAAIQELKAIVDAQGAEIAALKGAI